MKPNENTEKTRLFSGDEVNMRKNNMWLGLKGVLERMYSNGMFDLLVEKLEKRGAQLSIFETGEARDELAAIFLCVLRGFVVPREYRVSYCRRLHSDLETIQRKWDGDLLIIDYLERLGMVEEFLEEFKKEAEDTNCYEYPREKLALLREELDLSKRITGERYQDLCKRFKVISVQIDSIERKKREERHKKEKPHSSSEECTNGAEMTNTRQGM